MKEVWKELEYGYSVSNIGRVKNRFDNIKKNTLHHRGYLTTRYNKTMYSVHRLVAIAFIPNPENKPEINHKDGNKQNNHVDNLEWCTRKENIDHAFRLGLSSNKGEKNPRSKLNWDSVNKIRNLYNTGLYTQNKLAEMFGVSQSPINKLLNYKNWNEQ